MKYAYHRHDISDRVWELSEHFRLILRISYAGEKLLSLLSLSVRLVISPTAKAKKFLPLHPFTKLFNINNIIV